MVGVKIEMSNSSPSLLLSNWLEDCCEIGTGSHCHDKVGASTTWLDDDGDGGVRSNWLDDVAVELARELPWPEGVVEIGRPVQ